MVFSDQSFLFVFLPVALILGLCTRRTSWFAVTSLMISLVFFYWSSGAYTLVLLFSIILNFTGGLLIRPGAGKPIILLFIALNVALLAFFKYTYFAGSLIDFGGSSAFKEFAQSILLPIGISFYTFQGISYLIDVWRRAVEPEKNILVYGAYQSFFPQLIAGPIVRYKDVAEDFHKGNASVDLFSAGASRFLLGLGKKVIIADTVAVVADAAFALPHSEITFAAAWIGAIAYSIQIYYDFSGYSDMAIGLGMMFGIRFLENFNHPYAASTFTEFWRRWHISLSTWFRDYLYIPLGGNRVSTSRTYVNLMIVFLLTGLWHGAQWTFVLWGVWHGAFLIAERVTFKGKAAGINNPVLRLVYLLPFVVVGWVLFRAPDFATFLAFTSAMFVPFAQGSWVVPTELLLTMTPLATVTLIIASFLIILQGQIKPLGPILGAVNSSTSFRALRLVSIFAFSVACLVFVLPQSFSPFLYFRF